MRSSAEGVDSLATGPTGIHLLVPAAGRGERFGAAAPKLFLEVAKRPLLVWTIEALLEGGAASVTIALAADRIAGSREWLISDPRIRCTQGGETRQASVALALAACPAASEDLVGVHDGARPALSADDLRRVCLAAAQGTGAILGRYASDTVKRTRSGKIVETLDRRELFRAETPQVFRRRKLEEALRLAREDEFEGTDESSLVERLPGAEILAVEAGAPNPKLTVASDLAWIETLLIAKARTSRVREES